MSEHAISPIQRIMDLRSDGRDSVVPVAGPTEQQRRTYRPGRLDRALEKLASADPRPHAIFASGSAGSGKSAAVEEQNRTGRHLYNLIIEDATHSDSPSRDQAATLRERLAPLMDGAPRPPLPILVAANTGMLLKLFGSWRATGGGFSQLELAVLAPLGLREPAREPGDLRVSVLNLDERPTAGPEGLLSEFLPLLAPDDPAGIFGGSDGCSGCGVRDWCPVRSNAALAAGAAARGLDLLAATAARERGRHDSPRAIWDWVSRIVAPPAAFTGFPDPCDAVSAAAARGDDLWRLQNLLPVTTFAATGDLGRRVRALDPSLKATRDAYEILSAAGLDPARDAEPLERLAMLAPGAEALVAAAASTRAGRGLEGEDVAAWRSTIGKSGTGAGFFRDPQASRLDLDGVGAAFARALATYGRWQAARLRGASQDELAAIDREADEVLPPLIQDLGEGLARLFGVFAEGRPYLPLRSHDARNPSRVHVGVDVDLSTVQPVKDLAIEKNGPAALEVGHEPLSIRLSLEQGELLLDLPAYRLLVAAREHGLAAASQSDERFHALRRAAEALARVAAAVPDAPLLAEEDGTGRRFLITRASSMGKTRPLRARVVSA